MIIYENTKAGFVSDVRSGCIAQRVQNAFLQHDLSHSNEAEFRA